MIDCHGRIPLCSSREVLSELEKRISSLHGKRTIGVAECNELIGIQTAIGTWPWRQKLSWGMWLLEYTTWNRRMVTFTIDDISTIKARNQRKTMTKGKGVRRQKTSCKNLIGGIGGIWSKWKGWRIETKIFHASVFLISQNWSTAADPAWHVSLKPQKSCWSMII